MASATVISQLSEFRDILKAQQPLAPCTHLKVGGPAEALVEPRNVAELAKVVRVCIEKKIPLRVLGIGSNILVHDEGVKGVVVRLSEAPFTEITVTGQRVRAGCGAATATLVSAATRHNLAGLETLVGIPGTVGGGLRRSAADHTAEFGQCLRSVEVIDSTGTVQTRQRDDLAYSMSSLEDPVLVAAEFELEPDAAEAIVKRLRKAWIQRKASQPFSFQAAAQIFKNPRGLSAAAMIEQAGLVGTKVGAASVSDRHASYIVAEPGATARDVLKLIEIIRARVQERFHIELDLEVSVW